MTMKKYDMKDFERQPGDSLRPPQLSTADLVAACTN